MNSENQTQAITPKTPSELLELLGAHVNVTISVAGRDITLPVRCLTPAESRELQVLMDSVKPPMVTDGDDKDPKPNWEDPDFKRREVEASRLVRALALYYTCPLLRSATIDAVPPERRREAIANYMEEHFTERLLQILYITVSKDCSLSADAEAELGARVSFFSPAS